MAQAAYTEPVRQTVARVNDEVAVGEDLAFQRAWWRFERGVWVFFVLVIALDLIGALGRGPLANARLRAPDGTLDVRYERIERTGTPSMMTIEIGPAAMRGGAAQLFVSDKLVGALGAQRIIPQPASTVIGHGGLTYTFPASAPPASVRIELQPAGAGVYPFYLAVPGGATLSSKIFVLP